MRQWARVLVGSLLFASKHHGDASLRIELDDHVRALISHPDVVLRVDLHRVRK